MASNQKVGRIDQSEQLPDPHRGGVHRIQEDDQTDPTTVGEQIGQYKKVFKFLSNNSLTMVQVDRIDYDNEGNLLQYAVKMNQVGYLQILIDYGWAFFYGINFQFNWS